MATPREEIKIITDKEVMRKWSRSMRARGKRIGLVPTMGYLHQGHISLIKEARNHTELVVVSIYVNPSQFSPSEDLATYPSDFHGDIQKLNSIPGGVDVVFHPQNLYDYGESITNSTANCNIKEQEQGEQKGLVCCIQERKLGHETWVKVDKLGEGMCGKSRPVFFKGVATVVTKLFNIVEPDVAVFGKKDYQQWRIIRRLVCFFFPFLPYVVN